MRKYTCIMINCQDKYKLKCYFNHLVFSCAPTVNYAFELRLWFEVIAFNGVSQSIFLIHVCTM